MIILLILVAFAAAMGFVGVAVVLGGTQPPMPADMPSRRQADLEPERIPA